MRILCVIDSLGSGGAQRQLVSLAIEFKKTGHEVSFLVYHNENFFRDLLDNSDIKVESIIEPSYLKRLFKIRKYIRNGDYDAVLSFLEAANFMCEFAGLPWRNWKLVVGERSSNPNILKSAKLRIYRWFHFLADFIVSNSHENLALVRKINPLLRGKKCRVIYNMVDFDIWNPSSDYTFLKSRKLRLVVAASHQYLKNAHGLIKAVQILKDEDKLKLKIDWYGDESLDTSYKEAVKLVDSFSLNYIFHFHKATSALASEMQNADAIGLFSLYEGLPNTICEGMSLGKPIISSKISDIPILINDDELLFNPLEIDEISQVLSLLISLNSEKLLEIGTKNKELSRRLFKKELIMQNYLDLLI